MKLDLREIIDVPGGRVSFSQELSTERLSSPSIVRYDAGPSAEGVVENTAGVLTARGEIEAGMTCLCDRCGREFKRDKRIGFAVPIVPRAAARTPRPLSWKVTGWTLTTCWRRCTSWTWTRSISAGKTARASAPSAARTSTKAPAPAARKRIQD